MKAFCILVLLCLGFLIATNISQTFRLDNVQNRLTVLEDAHD